MSLQRFTNEERQKLFDSKPTRHYRPFLKTDPRNIIERASLLSLEDRPRHESSQRERRASECHSVARAASIHPSDSGTSSLSRSLTRSAKRHSSFCAVKSDCKPALREEPSRSHVISNTVKDQSDLRSNNYIRSDKKKFPSFSIIEDNSKFGLSKEPKSSHDVSGQVHCKIQQFEELIQESSVSKPIAGQGSLRSFPSSSHHLEPDPPCGLGKHGQSTDSTLHVSKRREKSLTGPQRSQNWRLVQPSSKHSDSDSGVEFTPQRTPSSPANVSSLTSRTLITSEGDEISHSLIPRNSRTDNKVNSWGIRNRNHPYFESDSSSDQSCSSFSEDIVCLNPDEPAPLPILLLPVPEHLKRRTSLREMDRASSPAESSSGFSSGSQRTEEVSSRCSFRSDSPVSISPVPRNEANFCSTQVGGVHDSDLKVEDVGVVSAGSSSTCNPSSDEAKVVASWKVKYTVDKPTKSPSNFHRACEQSSVSAQSCTQWNAPPEKALSSLGLPTAFGTPHSLKRKAVDSPRGNSNVQKIVSDCFSKRFRFKPDGWKLPDPADLFSVKSWEHPNFLELKQKLNNVKDELNDLPLQDWHAHTRRRNKAGNVIWQLRKQIDPEFPTQAWCKFYENVSSFPLVPQEAIDKKCLKSVHLCEAPGAFITALNHYLHVNYGRDFKFDWRAVTLNPYYEGNPLSCMINDDRLILKTLDKWLFGQDNTGDLMNRENLVAIMREASKMGDIFLITADGSFDCQDNPAEQEDIVSCLHFCESVAALQMLAPGGSFLIKMFTFYEHASICLLFLLNCVFRTVTVNKPATSKEGNSEVYVVCCGFVGASSMQPWLEVLMENYGAHPSEKALFPLEKIPETFLDQLYECADFFCEVQSDVIKRNIITYHNPPRGENTLIAAVRNQVAKTFFEKYKLHKLDRELCLVGQRQLKDVTTPNIDPRSEEGSFNDRRKRMAVSPEEELKYLEDDLLHLNVSWPGDFDVFWMDFPENPRGFKIVKGKPIAKVNSSKFCLGRLLKLRNRVREIAFNHFKVPVVQSSVNCDSRDIAWPDEEDDHNKKISITLNFKNELWASLEDGSNASHEKAACRKILSTIENKVFRDDCLELRGFPLLTQFNVGLVFLLGHLFEKVGFVRPVGQDIRVLFYKYRKFHPEMKHHWDEVVSAMDRDGEAVLSVVQISEMSDGDFYKYVTEINNLCVVEQIQDLLGAMSSAA